VAQVVEYKASTKLWVQTQHHQKEKKEKNSDNQHHKGIEPKAQTTMKNWDKPVKYREAESPK
jgi:hypothetical protein